MENRLIHVGKNAKVTQKRGPKIFTEQLGDRIYEQALFDKACSVLPIGVVVCRIGVPGTGGVEIPPI